MDITELHARIQPLTGFAKKVAALLIEMEEEAQTDYSHYNYEKLEKLEQLILTSGCKDISELFALGLAEMLSVMVGKDKAKDYYLYCTNLASHAYTKGMYRRSYHSTNPIVDHYDAIALLLLAIPLNKNADVLQILQQADKYDHRYWEACPSLTDKQTHKSVVSIPYFIAEVSHRLNTADPAYMQAVYDILTSETNTVSITHELISSIIKSNNEQTHTWLGSLLLAAQRQEGIRQAILEKADEGSLSTLVYFMTLIRDHQLLRFSSVQRAVATWTGLGYDVTDKKIIEKMFQLSLPLLKEEVSMEPYLESDDTIENTAVLWAAATKSKDAVIPILNRLLNQKKHQKLAALYFIRNFQNPAFSLSLVRETIRSEDDLDLLTFALLSCMENHQEINTYQLFTIDGKVNETYAYLEKERDLLERLAIILTKIKGKEHKVEGKPFPWISLSLTKEFLYNQLIVLAVIQRRIDRSEQLITQAASMSAGNRRNLLALLTEQPQTEKIRTFLFQSLSDRSLSNRKLALKHMNKLSIRKEELSHITTLLELKTGEIRQLALAIFQKETVDTLMEILPSLLTHKKQDVRLGALELLTLLEKKQQIVLKDAKSLIQLINKPTKKEQIYIERFFHDEQHPYTYENGLGLFQPNYQIANIPALPTNISGSLTTLMSFDEKKLLDKIQKLADLIQAHESIEYTAKDWNGGKTKLLIGNDDLQVLYEYAEAAEQKKRIMYYPLAEVWMNWMKEVELTWWDCENLLLYHLESYYEAHPWRQDLDEQGYELFNSFFDFDKADAITHFMCSVDYKYTIQEILTVLRDEFLQEAHAFELLFTSFVELLSTIPREQWYVREQLDEYYYEGGYASFPFIERLYASLRKAVKTDADFKKLLAIHVELTNRKQQSLLATKRNLPFGRLALQHMSAKDFAYAIELNLLPVDALYLYLLTTKEEELFFQKKEREKLENQLLHEVYEKMIPRVMDIELNRGDAETEVSRFIMYHLTELEGADYFIRILAELEGIKPVRGYVWGEAYTKREVFSHLLKISSPSSQTTIDELKTAVQQYSIPTATLIDAMMYSPKWIYLVSRYLGWTELESAAWYFRAHTSDYTTDWEEEQIRHYSKLSQEDFSDGAFDSKWFKECYQALGDTLFNQVYESAKYISDGAKHRRAQLFADAALGKLAISSLLKEIKEKRNKEKLRCMGLIPLSVRNPKEDALKRYNFIQTFIKESKKFGAQRKESEALAAKIALENLANTAGYEDITRFTWMMELFHLDMLQAYMQPKEIHGIHLSISINEEGMANLIVQNGEKHLKSVPAKGKKHAYVKELQQICKDLREQQKRAKKALEAAMEKEATFSYNELQNLLKHPIIAPMLSKILFISDVAIGYPTEHGLVTVDGKICPLSTSTLLRIAHPYDLYQSKEWRAYQHQLFSQKIKQPFKQVFRELYVVNKDEQEQIQSTRYAGHQIQPQKTVALLQSRGWVAGYYEGLRKIYYKENIVATLCLDGGDWFSPADIEAPTLEAIYFYHRTTRETIRLKDIPPIIFSETMRDIDLVVSVAHIGGVDIEASLSTVETRAAIIEELALSLSLENVSVKKHHAIIAGKLADYSVHLGSGVVHRLGGQMIPIVSIPSQHRGRIFLPFVDEDPRTAEIMSKILLLSADQKIKDPMILEAIQR